MKTVFYSILITPLFLFAQVGIGTTTPSNQLDVNGWVEIANETAVGNDVEGTIRYNSVNKCMEFYNGTLWDCIGVQPKIQNFTLRDGIDETVSGDGVTNHTNFNGGGYTTNLYTFTVNDIKVGDKILFLLEVVVNGRNLRKDIDYNNTVKIYKPVTTMFVEKEVPGVNDKTPFATFLWIDATVSGNVDFTFEMNCAFSDAKVTTVVF
ncbi:hypothetical protein [Pseudofulvibacter geojedonensis]|uniref:Uncharacterized protein n=1 Tax=Pseudofulvibacter geojedonensis TaxID=1123758 RepID=A0ABW3HZC3_9FLAO